MRFSIQGVSLISVCVDTVEGITEIVTFIADDDTIFDYIVTFTLSEAASKQSVPIVDMAALEAQAVSRLFLFLVDSRLTLPTLVYHVYGGL